MKTIKLAALLLIASTMFACQKEDPKTTAGFPDHQYGITKNDSMKLSTVDTSTTIFCFRGLGHLQ